MSHPELNMYPESVGIWGFESDPFALGSRTIIKKSSNALLNAFPGRNYPTERERHHPNSRSTPLEMQPNAHQLPAYSTQILLTPIDREERSPSRSHWAQLASPCSHP